MSNPSSPRVALVTGAGKRLGRDIALRLAASGWDVAIHYRHSAPEAEHTASDCRKLGVRSAAWQADLADEAQTRALVPQVVATWGQIDAVINSAATFEHDTAATFSHANLLQHLLSNTAAPLLLAQALHQHISERTATSGTPPQGAVVNMLDQKLWNMNPDFLSYTLSKAALESATTMLAMALAPLVRVVGVAPGLTLTSHMLTDERFAQLHQQSPLGRSSTPQDVVDTVIFALTNRSITGTSLLVDGGQHLMRFERDFSLM